MAVVAWIRETVASVISQRVASVLTLLVVATATAIVIVTAGRAAGAESAILADVDAVGTRSVTVRVSTSHIGFTAVLVSRLALYSDVIDQVAGFGPISDVTAIPGGMPVASRTFIGELDGDRLTSFQTVAGVRQALATSKAIAALGLGEGRGTVFDGEEAEVLITGKVDLPGYLSSLEPLVLVPVGPEADFEPLAMIVVTAHRPADLPLVIELISDAIGEIEPSAVTIETSERFAELRGVLEGQLSRQNHLLVGGILIASGLAIAVNVASLAVARRRDFGRRRALGATRSMILGLVIGQVILVAVAGSVIGSGFGAYMIKVSGAPLPPLRFLVATWIMFLSVAVVSAIAPAVWAANRDPIIELRLP